MVMSKIEKLKEAIKNPPPERIAKVEYRSHLFQGIGIVFVCIVLIAKGFWYIIFALIFGVGVSYSQGMSAYKRYLAIVSLSPIEKVEDYEKDISPTRRRSKIINSVVGKRAGFISATLSVFIAAILIKPEISRWFLSVSYLLTIIALYIFIYFFLFYWICYPFYKRKIQMKGG